MAEVATYYNLLAQQFVFIEHHRNIQIKNISAANLSTTGPLDAASHQLVINHDSVLRVIHDEANTCLNILVQKDTNLAVLDWLEETLSTHAFANKTIFYLAL